MGLINGAMAPPAAAGAPPPAAGAPAPGPAAGAAPQADPAIVQRVVLAASKIIHDKQAMPALIEQMKGAADPAQALAQVAVQVLARIYQASGKKIPPEALGQAGVEVIQMLGALAEKAGLFKFTMDILKQAVDIAGKLASSMQQQAAPPGGTATAAPPAAPAAGGMQQQATV